LSFTTSKVLMLKLHIRVDRLLKNLFCVKELAGFFYARPQKQTTKQSARGIDCYLYL